MSNYENIKQSNRIYPIIERIRVIHVHASMEKRLLVLADTFTLVEDSVILSRRWKVHLQFTSHVYVKRLEALP